jgi:hypothetical protein
MILVVSGGIVTLAYQATRSTRRMPVFLRRFGEVKRNADGRLNSLEVFPNWKDNEKERLDDLVMAISKLVTAFENI